MQSWLTPTFDALFDASSPRLRAWLGATREDAYGETEAARARTVLRRMWTAWETHGWSALIQPLAAERTYSEQAIRLYLAVTRVRALQAPTLRALRKVAPDAWQVDRALRTVLGTDTALRTIVQTYAEALIALADEARLTRGLLDAIDERVFSEAATAATPTDRASARYDLRNYARIAVEALESDPSAGAHHPLALALHHGVARAHGETSDPHTPTWRRYSIPAMFATENNATERAVALRAVDKLIVGLLAYGGRRTVEETRGRMPEADAHTFINWKDKELSKFKFDHEKPAQRGAHAELTVLVRALEAADVDPWYGLRLPFRMIADATRYPTDLASMRVIGGNLLTPADRADALTLIAATLARGREQARRYYPSFFADLPRVDWYAYNARGVKTPGGNYLWPVNGEPARIHVYLQVYAKRTGRATLPAKLLQTLVHEGAHHIWRVRLNEREQTLWSDLVTQRAPIDYNAILAFMETAWPPPAPAGWTKLPHVEADGPTVYGARWGEHDLFPIWRSQARSPRNKDGGLLEYDEDAREPLTTLAARLSLRADFYRAEGFDVSDAYTRDVTYAPGDIRRKAAMFLRPRGARVRLPHFDAAAERWRYPPPEEGTVLAFLPAIKEHDPALYLQIQIAASKYDADYWKKNGATAWAWLDPAKGDPKPLTHYTASEIEALRDRQEATPVPVFPVSGYGATNPEEAFCDALGFYVAYGPGAVLEPLRELLFRLLPRVRRNPGDSVVTADT